MGVGVGLGVGLGVGVGDGRPSAGAAFAVAGAPGGVVDVDAGGDEHAATRTAAMPSARRTR
jgi:hypothetical protein